MAEPSVQFGVILAGGRGARMGFVDKPLLKVGGKAIVEWIIERARGQVEELLLNVNNNEERYHYLQLTCFPDYTGTVSGPLVGIVSAMQFIRSRFPQVDDHTLLACFPGDVPWFPEDMVPRLLANLQTSGSDMVLANHDGQIQPLFSIWRLSLQPALERVITRQLYGPKMVLPKLNHGIEFFEDCDEGEFLNINNTEAFGIAQNLYKYSHKNRK